MEAPNKWGVTTKFQGMVTSEEYYMEKSDNSVDHFPKSHKRRKERNVALFPKFELWVSLPFLQPVLVPVFPENVCTTRDCLYSFSSVSRPCPQVAVSDTLRLSGLIDSLFCVFPILPQSIEDYAWYPVSSHWLGIKHSQMFKLSFQTNLLNSLICLIVWKDPVLITTFSTSYFLRLILPGEDSSLKEVDAEGKD